MRKTRTTRHGTYRSPLLASVYETAKGLHDAGVMDKETMRKFDIMCLTPVRPLTAKQIRTLRRREKASQAVFARYLNVTTAQIRRDLCSLHFAFFEQAFIHRAQDLFLSLGKRYQSAQFESAFWIV